MNPVTVSLPYADSRHADADGDGADTVRPRMEPRPRAEYAAVLRHNVDASATDQEAADQEPPGPETAGPEAAGPELQDPESRARKLRPEVPDQEAVDPQTELSAPDALQRFEPSRAGRPEVSHADAAAYIDEHQADRPWLTQARDRSPDAQRVIVALDQGHGHAHIRHEGYVTEAMNERRVRNLEDPAQLNQAKREAGIDAFKVGDPSLTDAAVLLPESRIRKPSRWPSPVASSIRTVQAALNATALPPGVPRPVRLPISDVLGEDGHKFCSGWKLDPVNGSMDEARANRNAWAAGDHSGPEPRTLPGGDVRRRHRGLCVPPKRGRWLS